MIESPNFLTENSESSTCIDKTFTVMKPILAWTGMGWEDEVGVGKDCHKSKIGEALYYYYGIVFRVF